MRGTIFLQQKCRQREQNRLAANLRTLMANLLNNGERANNEQRASIALAGHENKSPATISNQQRREQKKRQYRDWLANGSSDLRDAWVSVCPNAKIADTTQYRLQEIVQIVTTTAEIEGCDLSRLSRLIFQSDQEKGRTFLKQTLVGFPA
ncbi:MAG TPA: hypothetical protein VK633_07045 [Verrucomicrobiae bacterium]|nr:hypothetical protein [Verrucomicrobiae bacterium]